MTMISDELQLFLGLGGILYVFSLQVYTYLPTY